MFCSDHQAVTAISSNCREMWVLMTLGRAWYKSHIFCFRSLSRAALASVGREHGVQNDGRIVLKKIYSKVVIKLTINKIVNFKLNILTTIMCIKNCLNFMVPCAEYPINKNLQGAFIIDSWPEALPRYIDVLSPFSRIAQELNIEQRAA